MRTFILVGCILICLGSSIGLAEVTAPDSTIINTEAAWQKVSAARDAAARDQHHDAVGQYLDALANDARLVQVVAKEIGYQKLWREDADKAIFYFHRYLARHPGQENRDVKRGLALAYSWSGRQPEAVRMYRQLAESDPNDGGSRVGLGRTLIWNNQLNEGFSVLRQIEDEFPADHAAKREARNFLLTFLDSYTTPLDVEFKASWDSDDLDIYRVKATGAFTVLGNKLALFQPAWATYRHPAHADITAPRLGAGLVGSLAHNWAFHAYGWMDFFRSRDPLFGSPEKLSWNRPGGDVWLTWLPAARWRVDFGGNSQAVETYYALNNKLHYEQANASVDWRFARHWSTGLAGNLADYSDGNTKKRAKAHLRWKHEGRWQLQLGPDLTYMDFTRPYPGGYWAPDWVRNGSLVAILATRGTRWTFQIDGSLGREKETGAEAITVGGASARVGWRVGRGSLLALQAGYSKSSLDTDSGYQRTFAALNFKAAF